MKTILLSIKPIYAERILKGEKLFEYRKSFPNHAGRRVLLYATAPIKRIVGEFRVDSLMQGDKETIWHETGAMAGISREYFDAYYERYITALAIRVGSVVRYEEPRVLADYGIKHAPQSFCYVRENDNN